MPSLMGVRKVPLLYKKPAVVVAASGASYTDHGSVTMTDSGDATTWTAALPENSVGADLFFLLAWEDSDVLSSGTMNGDAISIHVQAPGSGARNAAIMHRAGTYSASDVLSLTFADTLVNACAPRVTFVAVSGLVSTTPVDTDSSNGDTLAALTNCGADGIMLAVATERNQATSLALTQVDTLDNTPSTFAYVAGALEGPPAADIAHTPTGGTEAIVGASYN